MNPTRCTISRIYFILEQHSTCFGLSLRPSSGVYDYTYSVRYMSYRFCGCLLAETRWNSFSFPASKRSEISVWHIPHAVCIVLDSWWWTERQSETCRVLFQNKINLRYCASGWFYYRNILRCTVLQTSNQILWKFVQWKPSCSIWTDRQTDGHDGTNNRVPQLCKSG